MKMIKKDGWQFWVEIYDDYVIKTPKKKEEIAVNVKKYLDYIGKPEELEKRTLQMLEDIKNSTRIINNSNIPKKLLADLEFIEERKIKQKTAKVFEKAINESENPLELIDKAINFLIKLWTYGIHEKTFKFLSNLGVIKEEVVLLDPFELTDKREKVEKQIIKKSWKKKILFEKKINKEIKDYFLEKCEELLTIENLNKNWGIKE
jgi:hypothetical protein